MSVDLKGLCAWLKETKGITKIDMMELVEYNSEYEEFKRDKLILMKDGAVIGLKRERKHGKLSNT